MTEVQISIIIAVKENDKWLAQKEAKKKLISNIEECRADGTLKEYVDSYFRAEMLEPDLPSWTEAVDRAARDLIRENFIPEIIGYILDDGEASSDMYNDYADGDGIFHEQIIDQDWSVKEAMEMLATLGDFEEDDFGLWEGKDWEDILRIKAAYTFGNAVNDEWYSLISDINEIDLDEAIKAAVRASIKELKPFKCTVEDRECLKTEDLEWWLDETHNGICKKHLTAILEKEIEEVLK